jgi:glucokinase
MILAGDVGGTKTLLGLFTPGVDRPAMIEVGEFVTLDYDGLEAIIEAFLGAWRVEPRHLDAAAIGIAGAIKSQVGRMTNVPWVIEAAALSKRTGIGRVRLLNDLEALAYAVPVLEASELEVLQQGTRVETGNAAVIAAGTGLGESFLYYVAGRLAPGASEGGHADFAARTPRELEMVGAMARIFSRVSAETVISGPGLVNVYQFTHDAFGSGPLLSVSSIAPARLCEAVGSAEELVDLPARISQAAMKRECPHCVEAMDIFVGAYGAEAGNMALRGTATAGVFVGGGIAPKILPALRSSTFIDAFCDKEPLSEFVRAVPVSVILNDDAGLLGAAVGGQELVRGRM